MIRTQTLFKFLHHFPVWLGSHSLNVAEMQVDYSVGVPLREIYLTAETANSCRSRYGTILDEVDNEKEEYFNNHCTCSEFSSDCPCYYYLA
jgi:hypothetical protein